MSVVFSRKQQICGKKQAQPLPEKAAGLERKRGSEEAVDLGKNTQKQRRTTTTKFPKKQSFHRKIDRNKTGKSLFVTTPRSGFIFNYRPNPTGLVASPGHPTGREIKADKGELANNKNFATRSREAMSLFLIYLYFPRVIAFFPSVIPTVWLPDADSRPHFMGARRWGGVPPGNVSGCPNGSRWIMDVFNECAQDGRDVASVILGLVSILCFAAASFP